jgi:SAM-dependent methyltransferase
MSALLVAIGAPAVAQDEVPFVTTPDRVTLAMLRLAEVGPKDHLIDLGSGDGRIVITAARRFGASGLGVGIVPELVQRSRATAERAGVAGRAQFVEQDLFKSDLAPASVITMYLLPEVNLQLRPRLLALKPGTRLVSHDWDMGDWPPDQTLTLEVPEKTIGREKLSRVHLWWVPAPVNGVWCGPAGQRLELTQTFQHVRGTFRHGLRADDANGRLRGAQLWLQGLHGRLQARWVGPGELQVTAAAGAWNASAGRRWLAAAADGSCPSARGWPSGTVYKR